jgi:predicted nucleic acid-binding protein
MKRRLVDTGFWISLYEERSEYYDKAQTLLEKIEEDEGFEIILPFPTLYEFVNTRFARRITRINAFEAFIRQPHVKLWDDTIYQEAALADFFEKNKQGRSLSLVDCVIRQMLDDTDLNIEGLICFNLGDFIDICRERKIQIYSD